MPRHGADLLYTIPSFHNPTGKLMSEDRKRELIQISKQLSLLSVHGLQRRRRRAVKLQIAICVIFNNRERQLLADLNQLILYVGTLSKTVSPGLRIGWVAGPEPVIERLADIKMQTDYGSSSLSQWAAAKWLSSGLYDENLSRIKVPYRRGCRD